MSLQSDMQKARNLGITYGEYVSRYKAPKVEAAPLMVTDEGIACEAPVPRFRCDRPPNMRIIYPALREYIRVNCKNSIYEFSDKLKRSPSSAYNWLYGRHETTQGVIDAVLALTGMTYEQAFRRDKHEP